MAKRFMFYARTPQGGGQPDKLAPAIFCVDLYHAQRIVEALQQCNPDYAKTLVPFEVTLKSNLDIQRDKQYSMGDLTKRNWGLTAEEQKARDAMENHVRKEGKKPETTENGGYDSGNKPLHSEDIDSEDMRAFREWQRQNRATNVPEQVTQGNQGSNELTASERQVLESEPGQDQQTGTDNQGRESSDDHGQKKSANVQDQGHIGTDGVKADWKDEEQGNGQRGSSQPR